MTNRDIIDDIDALVDEQMAGYRDRSGNDHNVNQDRCWHCGDDWHGLPITERMRRMRNSYCGCGTCVEELDSYRRADDESPIICQGSDTIGPARQWPPTGPYQRGIWGLDLGSWTIDPTLPPELQFPPQFGGFAERARRQRERIRQLAAGTAVPSATYQPMQRLVAGDRIVVESDGRRHEVVVLDVQQRGDRIEYTTADPRYSARAQQLASVRDRIRRGETPLPSDTPATDYVEGMLAESGFRIEPWQRGALRRLMSWPNPFELANVAATRFRPLDELLPERWLPDDLWAAAIEPETAPEAPQQRALPRPSHTPPMWAVQPNRRNRRRNR